MFHFCCINCVGLSLCRDPSRYDGVRFWSVHFPLSSSATSYATMAVFIILYVWSTDSYALYTRAIRLWTDYIRPSLDQAARIFYLIIPHEFWHPSDLERIFSHLPSLPVSMRLYFCNSRYLPCLSRLASFISIKTGKWLLLLTFALSALHHIQSRESHHFRYRPCRSVEVIILFPLQSPTIITNLTLWNNFPTRTTSPSIDSTCFFHP